jgi:Uncharacterised nucleotidyltransferase
VAKFSVLTEVLAGRAHVRALTPVQQTSLVRMARREKLLATLAHVTGKGSGGPIEALLEASRPRAQYQRQRIEWEAQLLAEELAPLGCPVVLLKGAAYAIDGSSAALGRTTGDLDVLVPRSWLGAVELRLADCGWSLLKSDPYDDAYYRQWMHEIPPLQHPDRALLLDLHHTILPLTARITPDANAFVANARSCSIPAVLVPSLADQIVHSALHLFYDGDLDGGLRNLWDIACLLADGAADRTFLDALDSATQRHQAGRPIYYALRYAGMLFGSQVQLPAAQASKPLWPLLMVMDWLVLTRLADVDWLHRSLTGRLARFALYVRSHWLRMPPLMLARHLMTKAMKRLRQRSA